jgi:hypothetical protein
MQDARGRLDQRLGPRDERRWRRCRGGEKESGIARGTRQRATGAAVVGARLEEPTMEKVVTEGESEADWGSWRREEES